jgi:hypothetical protein
MELAPVPQTLSPNGDLARKAGLLEREDEREFGRYSNERTLHALNLRAEAKANSGNLEGAFEPSSIFGRVPRADSHHRK